MKKIASYTLALGLLVAVSAASAQDRHAPEGHDNGGGGGHSAAPRSVESHEAPRGAEFHAAPHAYSEHRADAGGAPRESRDVAPEHAAGSSERSHSEHSESGFSGHDEHASHHYHDGDYHAPAGYQPREWHDHDRLPPGYFAREYWIGDFIAYGLFAPPPECTWVRVGDDALLVDQDTGEVVQVEYDVFD